MEVRVTEGGRVVIPSQIRNEAGIVIGDRVNIALDEDGSVRISTRKQNFKKAQELFRKHVQGRRALADELIADRRREASDE
jgi:AbrB family looped-hinge helix DNA binding protein